MWVMKYWLIKTEPGAYSWDDLVREKRTVWDGIKNPLALGNMKQARAGDRILVYHSGSERRAVGIARVVKGAYLDPNVDDAKRFVVDIAALEPLGKPVTLDRIKADPVFEGWDLLRLGRLSFVPVPATMWRRVLELASTS